MWSIDAATVPTVCLWLVWPSRQMRGTSGRNRFGPRTLRVTSSPFKFVEVCSHSCYGTKSCSAVSCRSSQSSSRGSTTEMARTSSVWFLECMSRMRGAPWKLCETLNSHLSCFEKETTCFCPKTFSFGRVYCVRLRHQFAMGVFELQLRHAAFVAAAAASRDGNGGADRRAFGP